MRPTTLHQISAHVYWAPPARPDRPSLCAVRGRDHTLMLDGGASDDHARGFLDLLAAQGVQAPAFTVLTHADWDHVLGAAEMGGALMAHRLTAARLEELAELDWSDTGLDRQIALGTQSAKGVENIKAELPAPRTVRIARPTLIFNDSLELRVGGVTCRIGHVGGDHAPDSSVIFVEPDRVLFLGDCLYDSRGRYYTARLLLPLLDKLRDYDAAYYVEGHEPRVLTRREFDDYAGKLREATRLVQSVGDDEEQVFAAASAMTGKPPDEDMAYFLRALIAGLDK